MLGGLTLTHTIRAPSLVEAVTTTLGEEVVRDPTILLVGGAEGAGGGGGGGGGGGVK